MMGEMNSGRAMPSARATAASAVEPVPVSSIAGIPIALEELCSERVLIACSAAKAVPGDVWGRGAEGHYAFLMGLAALLRIPSDDMNWACSHEARTMKAFAERHPDTDITLRCPDRILIGLGFAQGIEAGTDETPQEARPEGQEPGPKDAPEGTSHD